MEEQLDIHTVNNFYGVYLLFCKNPKYLGRTYIGYTVNPNRRIKQHNKGKKAGGAWRTSQRGPWEMVMIIHGFPNDVAALRFEWAWQHPLKSRRLNHVSRKKTKEKNFDYCLRILSEMLIVGPWKRLPLTIRWLNQEFCRNFPIDKIPPIHMPICYGPVISKKLPKSSTQLTQPQPTDLGTTNITCSLCHQSFTEDSLKLTCLVSQCNLQSHIICLSKHFLEQGEFVPIRGECPKCGTECLWGDLVRKSQGCYEDFNLEIDTGNADSFYESEDSD